MCQHHARHAEGAGAAEQRASRRGQTRTWHPSAAVRSGRRAADCLAAAGFFGLLPLLSWHMAPCARTGGGEKQRHRARMWLGSGPPRSRPSRAPQQLSPTPTPTHRRARRARAPAAQDHGPLPTLAGYQNVKTGDLHKSTCAKERDSSSRHGGSTRLWPGCAAENWGSGGAGPRSSHALVPAPTLARRRRARGARGLLCGLLGRLGRRSGRAAGRSRAAA